MTEQQVITAKQLKILKAVHTIVRGRFSGKANTSDVAQYAGTNTLAAHNTLEFLTKHRFVRSCLLANASVSGGAYRNGWQLTVKGRSYVERLDAEGYLE